jgi:hypothetical protein
MPTILTDKAVELSTYAVNVSFYDENSAAVAPNSLYWTLSDPDGNVVNAHSGTAIESVQTSVDIVLQGSDLLISSGSLQAEEERVLTIQGNYNSSLGNALPLNDRVKFTVINLSAI